MHYIRYPHAAVAIGATEQPAKPPFRQNQSRGASAPLVLWASQAYRARDGGRLVGVRRRGSFEVEVAWLGLDREAIDWVPATLVLTDQEARHWLKVARFSRY